MRACGGGELFLGKFGGLFAGIGGFDLGFERAGMECVWQVEIDDYCNKVLEKHWPDVKRYGDIRSFADAIEEVNRRTGGAISGHVPKTVGCDVDLPEVPLQNTRGTRKCRTLSMSSRNYPRTSASPRGR